MWYPKVKIHMLNSANNKYYKENEWIFLSKFKTKNLYFRYKHNNDIEFLIDGYLNKKAALINGKILFFNVLFNGYKSFFNFQMGDGSYVTRWYNQNCKCTQKEFFGNQEYFFTENKSNSNDLGLVIYKANSIEELDKYRKLTGILIGNITQELDIIKWVKDIDYTCLYTSKCQKIFHLLNLIENADINIKILLLCQALEYMGTNEKRSTDAQNVIKECITVVENSNIEDAEKKSLKGALNGLKNESSNHKIEKLLGKYNTKKYKFFDKYKLVKECYKLRSKIIHGEIIDEIDDGFDKTMKLKAVVLDTFKEWSKQNKD